MTNYEAYERAASLAELAEVRRRANELINRLWPDGIPLTVYLAIVEDVRI